MNSEILKHGDKKQFHQFICKPNLAKLEFPLPLLRIFFQQRLQQGDSLIGAEQTAGLHGTIGAMAWCNAARSRQITMNGAFTPMLQLKNIL